MTYDPEFPYRINGGQVSADSVGVGLPMPGEENERALEVTCTKQGITLELEGESVHISASELRHRYYREVNERNKEDDERARILSEVEAKIDEYVDEPNITRKAAAMSSSYQRIRDIDTPHAQRVKERIANTLFGSPSKEDT